MLGGPQREEMGCSSGGGDGGGMQKGLVQHRPCGAAKAGLGQSVACYKKPGKDPPVAQGSVAAATLSVQCVQNTLVGKQHGTKSACLASQGQLFPRVLASAGTRCVLPSSSMD